MSNKKQILIVDDEVDICKLLEYNLTKEGFYAESLQDGATALKRLKTHTFDLMILDLMLPEIDGIQLCRLIREDPQLKTLPIIMLTAKDEELDRVLGLEIGADDYVTKPFSVREVVARVKAVLRRTGESLPEKTKTATIKVDDLIIDLERFSVTKAGRPIELSAREFRLLQYLAEHPGRVYNRDFLLDAVWGNDAFVEPRTVDVYIRRIREKIEDDPSNPSFIKTKRGIGYYFKER
ncbi:MAG: response regulator transcription factor [Nitrospirae bacterium]|nr:response regulator transcription factor [Nitrospirota bacterium]